MESAPDKQGSVKDFFMKGLWKNSVEDFFNLHYVFVIAIKKPTGNQLCSSYPG